MENTSTQQTDSFKRATAVKVRLSDLVSGSWKEKFLELQSGETLSRARIMCTVVGKFVSEDQKFASLTLDDSTDTIRAKAWDNTKLLEALNAGDIIDMIGKVREYNQEIYLVPEIIRKISDPNLEVLRQLELVKKYGPTKVQAEEKPETERDPAETRKDVLKIITESPEGIPYSEILEKTKAPQAEIENIINDLLSGGLCWEPSPGVIKKI